MTGEMVALDLATGKQEWNKTYERRPSARRSRSTTWSSSRPSTAPSTGSTPRPGEKSGPRPARRIELRDDRLRRHPDRPAPGSRSPKARCPRWSPTASAADPAGVRTFRNRYGKVRRACRSAVSPVGDKATATRRPHDAEASRRALLEAARGVFDEVGYDRATTREIGERAGVDPALIARYFDSKEGLFIATIAAGSAEEEGSSSRRAALLALPARALGRTRPQPDQPRPRQPGAEPRRPRADQRRGRRPRPRRPRRRAARARRADPELRAELLVALAVGVAMTRANGTLETLAAAPREQVLATLAPLLEALAR